MKLVFDLMESGTYQAFELQAMMATFSLSARTKH